MVRAALAVDGARQHGRARRLGHHVRLAGEVRLVHDAVAFSHGAVHRADLVREDDQRVADRHRVERHVGELPIPLAVCHRGHAPGQRRQHGRGAANGVGLQGLPAREHEHDQRTGQVLAEHDRRDDRDAGQQVGAELAPEQLEQQFEDEVGSAAGQSNQEWDVGQRPAENGFFGSQHKV